MVSNVSRRRTFVYIDGLNFYNCIKGTRYKWVDFMALADRLAPADCDVVAVKYFTAQISGKAAEDPESPRRQRVFIRAIAADSAVEVIEGKF